jgi:hypothetical protein
LFLIVFGLLNLFYIVTGGYYPPDLLRFSWTFSFILIIVGVILHLLKRDQKEAERKKEAEERARQERERDDWWNDQR